MHWLPQVLLYFPSVAGNERLVGLGGGGALVGHEQVLGWRGCVPSSTWLTIGLLLLVDGSLVIRAS